MCSASLTSFIFPFSLLWKRISLITVTQLCYERMEMIFFLSLFERCFTLNNLKETVISIEVYKIFSMIFLPEWSQGLNQHLLECLWNEVRAS